MKQNSLSSGMPPCALPTYVDRVGLERGLFGERVARCEAGAGLGVPHDDSHAQETVGVLRCCFGRLDARHPSQGIPHTHTQAADEHDLTAEEQGKERLDTLRHAVQVMKERLSTEDTSDSSAPQTVRKACMILWLRDEEGKTLPPRSGLTDVHVSKASEASPLFTPAHLNDSSIWMGSAAAAARKRRARACRLHRVSSLVCP